MKLGISSAFLSSVATAVAMAHCKKRGDGGYVQLASGNASFTTYSGCGTPGTVIIHRQVAQYADYVLL
jgi:hypothetical protein